MSDDYSLLSDEAVAPPNNGGSNPACDDDPEKYKWALYAFIGLFAYSAVLLLGTTIFLIVYRQYLRFICRKKTVYKPGMTVDETMTTMGTMTQTEVSVMNVPSKDDKKNKDDKNR